MHRIPCLQPLPLLVAVVLTVVLASFATPSSSVAQTLLSNAEIEALVRSRVEEDRAVGMVIGVLEADGSTRVVSYGEAGPGAQPLSSQSVFEIGSITKVFTGTLLADMVARGEVSLGDPVVEYLPRGVTMPLTVW